MRRVVLGNLVLAAMMFSSASMSFKKNNDVLSGDVPSELVGNWSREKGEQCDGFSIAWDDWAEENQGEGRYYFQYFGGNDGYDISVSKNTVSISMGEYVAGTFDYSIRNGKLTITKATGDFEELIASSFIKLKNPPDCW
jgi:hypothetical protein